MKSLPALFVGLLFFLGVSINQFSGEGSAATGTTIYVAQTHNPKPASVSFSPFAVDDVVAKANALKALLSTTQINTLQIPFTVAAARRWSNLPCGSMCRNGIQFSTLNSTQLAAAKEVIAAASGTVANEGYDEFIQITLADSVLGTVGGGGYSKGIYFIAFLNEPTTTGAWMLQFGGHHYAANIAFNGGKVVGASPTFEGVEPRFFTIASGAAYAPINQERAGMQTMLASLSTSQLATAKLSTTYSDVLLGPNQDGNFPATKSGLPVSALSPAQKALVLAAMEPWIRDVDDASAATLLSIYQNELESTYISYAGNTTAVAGDSSTFLRANTDYVRLDGPSVWIEFVCQNGVVFSGIHYHTIYRDHTRDYGAYLANTSLPLHLLGFDVKLKGRSRIVSWITADESEVSHFEVERSTSASGGFTAIKQVAAKNGVSNSYSYTDDNTLIENTSYYRLKMVDRDGYSSYSKTIAVKNDVIKDFSLYPNPGTDYITLTFPAAVTNATIKINNTDGKTIITHASQSGNKLGFDISRLPGGNYFIQLIEKGTTITTNFVKQ